MTSRSLNWLEKTGLVLAAPVVAIVLLATLMLLNFIFVLALPILVILFILAVLFGEVKLEKYVRKANSEATPEDAKDLKW